MIVIHYNLMEILVPRYGALCLPNPEARDLPTGDLDRRLDSEGIDISTMNIWISSSMLFYGLYAGPEMASSEVVQTSLSRSVSLLQVTKRLFSLIYTVRLVRTKRLL